MAKTKTQYRVKTGLHYGTDKRAEAGAVVSDLPKESIAWLLEQGHIELVAEEAEEKSE